MRELSVFVDLSNIFYSGRRTALEMENEEEARRVRLNFDALYDLARGGRPVASSVCVASFGCDYAPIVAKLQALGIETEVFERGVGSGREQAVDQALQVHMLRALADRPPGVAVVMTGDGSGVASGKGFFADLKRMRAAGWEIELISWRRSCHTGLRDWVEANGRFICLDDYYPSVTFVCGGRRSAPLTRRPHQYAVDTELALAA